MNSTRENIIAPRQFNYEIINDNFEKLHLLSLQHNISLKNFLIKTRAGPVKGRLRGLEDPELLEQSLLLTS